MNKKLTEREQQIYEIAYRSGVIAAKSRFNLIEKDDCIPARQNYLYDYDSLSVVEKEVHKKGYAAGYMKISKRMKKQLAMV